MFCFRKRRSSDNVENNVKNDEEIKYLQKVSMQSSSYKEPNCTPVNYIKLNLFQWIENIPIL